MLVEMDCSLHSSSLPSLPSPSTPTTCPHVQLIRRQIEAAKDRVELLSSELMVASQSLQDLYRQLRAHACSSHAPVRRVGFSASLPSPQSDEELIKDLLEVRRCRALAKERELERELLLERKAEVIPVEDEETELEKERERERETELEEMSPDELVRQMQLVQSIQDEQEEKGKMVEKEKEKEDDEEKDDKDNEEAHKEEGEDEEEELSPGLSIPRLPSSMSCQPLGPSDCEGISASVELALRSLESQHPEAKSQREDEPRSGSEETGPGEKVIETIPAKTLTFSFESLESEGSDEEQEAQEEDESPAPQPLCLKRRLEDASRPSQKRQRLDRKEGEGDGGLEVGHAMEGKEGEEGEEKRQRRILRKIWKRHDVTRRLQRLATNGEELEELLKRMMRQMEEQEVHRKAALEELGKRKRRRRSGERRSQKEKELERTKTMEETVLEGCSWLLALLQRPKQG